MLLAFKSTLFAIIIATPAFFWLMFVCYNFLRPFTFNLAVSFYRKEGHCAKCLRECWAHFKRFPVSLKSWPLKLWPPG